MNEEYLTLFIYLFSLFVATGTFGVLVYTYLKYKIKALFFWSAAWMFFILMQVAFYTGNKERVAIFYSFFSGTLIYGALVYFKEHGDFRTSIKPELIGVIPPLFALYSMLLVRLDLPYSFSSVEVPSVILSGIFFLFSGFVLLAMGKKQRNSFYLGILTIAFGIFVLLYLVRMSFSHCPFVWILRLHFAWILIGTVLSVGMAFFMIKLVTSREFLFFEEPVEVKVVLEPGAKVITPEEYEQVKKEFKDYPALAFVRSLNVPEKWRVYYLSTEEREGRISPTNLAYITHLVNEYFKEAKEKGVRGVVVIDCPEYLVMYNGFESIAKFLASLKDFAVVNMGVLLVVIDEEAWDKRQLAILRRLFS
ncbi:DUF835 domain-containing protein [Thermococcus aggregans]|uniref:DUF835 domain-containing protein n=1 Tax=Thermococcus aggregans TaxID=110163 RepID=A0A9E7MWD4_THEAG|nr:DUF835 domain-containing protein [Thermococcus aggregans]USS40154.1 DUF835 domain-containing protein [Thermococcus aggregans]